MIDGVKVFPKRRRGIPLAVLVLWVTAMVVSIKYIPSGQIYWVIPLFCILTWLIGAWGEWFERRRQVNKSSLGSYCRRCGYDLCATPDRCPECGKIVERTI